MFENPEMRELMDSAKHDHDRIISFNVQDWRYPKRSFFHLCSVSYLSLMVGP